MAKAWLAPLRHGRPQYTRLLVLLISAGALCESADQGGESEGSSGRGAAHGERGRDFPVCWLTAEVCARRGNARYEGEVVLGIQALHGKSWVGAEEEERRCLEAAWGEWDRCGNTLWQPVMVEYMRAPGIAQGTAWFPPPAVAMEAADFANTPPALGPGHRAVKVPRVEDPLDFVLEHVDEYDEDLREYKRNPLDYMRERSTADDVPNGWPEEEGEEDVGGWKTVQVFVGKQPLAGDDPMSHWNGQHAQDLVAMELLGFKRGGFFLDVGAFDAVSSSNTVSMERFYGWDGICVEAQAQQLWGLSHRKCALVQAVVAGETDNEVLFTNKGPEWCGYSNGCGGIVSPWSANKEAHPDDHMRRPTVTLRKLLRDLDAPQHIDFVSLDVEGAEAMVLEGFPFKRHSVGVWCVETKGGAAVALLEEQGYAALFRVHGDIFFVGPGLEGFEGVVSRFQKDEFRRKG